MSAVGFEKVNGLNLLMKKMPSFTNNHIEPQRNYGVSRIRATCVYKYSILS